MKRLVILAMILCFALGIWTAGSAEYSQTVSGMLGEGDEFVRVTVDVSGNWSVRFLPTSFSLYDGPFTDADAVEAARGTVLDAAGYAALPGNSGEGAAQEGGSFRYVTADGWNGYCAPVSKDRYITLEAEPSQNPDVLWGKLSWTYVSYAAGQPAQLVSGVIADVQDHRVCVTLSLSGELSAEFLPMSFFLYEQRSAEPFAFGSLMNAEGFAALKEYYANPAADETSVLEEKDGFYLLTGDTEGAVTACYMPVDGGEVLILFTVNPADMDYARELVVSCVSVAGDPQ